jgi:hypothetical protein
MHFALVELECFQQDSRECGREKESVSILHSSDIGYCDHVHIPAYDQYIIGVPLLLGLCKFDYMGADLVETNHLPSEPQTKRWVAILPRVSIGKYKAVPTRPG